MKLDHIFNNQKEAIIIEDNEIEEIHSKSISIKIYTSDYEEYMNEEFEELKRYNEIKKTPWSDEEYQDTKKELTTIISQTRKNLIEFYNKISILSSKLLENWSESTIIIKPIIPSDKEFIFTPVNDFTVIVFNGVDGADFTVFDGGRLIDDILDVGDTDFFQNQNLESDYFLLVNFLLNPNYEEKSRIITLYTARPKRDKDIYLKTSKIPVGIFLTTNINDVEGIANDMQDRDIYKIKIDSKFLTKTLQRNNLMHFQSFNPNSRFVPIEDIEKLT